MQKLVKRGRPSKKVVNNNATFKVNTVKMNDLSFDDKLDEIGVEIGGRNDNEVTITLADLFSESLQLNLFNENARDMITRIISNKLGSNVGGWHENSYEFRDENKFDKESFNRGVERQFEKIVEIIEEKG